MSIEIGSLMIDLRADVARLQTDMGNAIRTVDSSMGRISSAASTAMNALGMIGAGFAAKELVSMVQGSIDAADALNDLSKKTGVAVEQLGAWKLVASQSGTDLDALANSLGKASKYMVEHGDNLQKLGIHATTAEEVIIQLAGVLSKLPDDDPRRVAIAMEVLGKGAQALLPLLSEGESGLRKMLDVSKEYNKITPEMAKHSDEFNDQLDVMKTRLHSGWDVLANYMLPALTKFMWLINDSKPASVVADDAFNELLDLNKKLNIFKESKKKGFYVDDEDIADIESKIKAAQKRLTTAIKQSDKEISDAAASYVTPSMTKETQNAVDSVMGGKGGKGSKGASSKDNWYQDLQKQEMADQLKEWDEIARKREQILKDMDEQDLKRQLNSEETTITLDKENLKLREQAEALRLTVNPLEAFGKEWADILTMRDKYPDLIDDQTLQKLAKSLSDQYSGAKKVNSIGHDLGMTFQSAFEDAISGGKKFSQVLQSLGADIEKLLTRRLITEPMMKGLDSLISPLTDKAGDWFSGLFASANGNVFMGGRPMAFASGGVVGGPTVFDMGLMGEAGPEAIMPLARGSDGKLGVRSGSSGGASVNVNIINNGAPAQASVSQRNDASGGLTLDVILKPIKAEIIRDISRGGEVADAMQQQYGLSRLSGAQR